MKLSHLWNTVYGIHCITDRHILRCSKKVYELIKKPFRHLNRKQVSFVVHVRQLQRQNKLIFHRATNSLCSMWFTSSSLLGPEYGLLLYTLQMFCFMCFLVSVHWRILCCSRQSKTDVFLSSDICKFYEYACQFALIHHRMIFNHNSL